MFSFTVTIVPHTPHVRHEVVFSYFYFLRLIFPDAKKRDAVAKLLLGSKANPQKPKHEPRAPKLDLYTKSATIFSSSKVTETQKTRHGEIISGKQIDGAEHSDLEKMCFTSSRTKTPTHQTHTKLFFTLIFSRRKKPRRSSKVTTR